MIEPEPQEGAPIEVERFELDGWEFAVIEVDHDPARLGELPSAEREVAGLAVGGFSNREIAARRGTSERTVANQLRRIFGKLGLFSRFELARLSRERASRGRGAG